jgi:hypothetical protein
MRTLLACFLLAAVIAMPGIVVAATSSERHGSPLVVVGRAVGTAVATTPRGPINPALRPAANAVKAAFAAKGIGLTVEPLGGEAAEAFAIDPSSRCPTVITFELGNRNSHLTTGGACPGEGSVQANGLTITYTPASLRPTIDRALATLPG